MPEFYMAPLHKVTPLSPMQASLPLLGLCPTTGRLTKSGSVEQYFIPEGQVVWWQCAECTGWHIILVSDQDNNSI